MFAIAQAEQFSSKWIEQASYAVVGNSSSSSGLHKNKIGHIAI